LILLRCRFALLRLCLSLTSSQESILRSGAMALPTRSRRNAATRRLAHREGNSMTFGNEPRERGACAPRLRQPAEGPAAAVRSLP